MIIPARFNGPPDSGNGGVSAGLLADHLPADTAVQVTLRLPPPLGTELTVEHQAGRVRLLDGETLIADALVSDEEFAPVPPVGFEDAAEASTRFPGFISHPFPTCFGCGHARPDQDGLALYAGPIGHDEVATAGSPAQLATPFVPREISLGPTLVWAALDCPGGWSVGLVGRRAVLGRMTARIHAMPDVGEPCVVTAATDGWAGRKAFSRTSAYGADGRLLGKARQTWIELN